ncbi:uncharacterized protein LODBEIA_P01560 [Lodderomyces beijingensis]|uniref:26S proteasome complex subunit SEM1 n=1 Tax=Lodderomyces beijingensis TaxID=1775926 RepID=A0ABP0ZEP2_9ASCO
MSDARESKAKESRKNDDKIRTLEEDDEFEDFPEDEKDWTSSKIKEETLWEQDWDDDDNQDHFSQKLKEELLKSQKPATASAK